jgi:hypothetical protein
MAQQKSSKQLINNKDANSYVGAFYNYHQRQLLLSGNAGLLDSVDLRLMFSGLRFTFSLKESIVFYDTDFRVDSDNREEQKAHLINYVRLMFVAQSFESFVGYMKDIVIDTFKEQIKDKHVLEYTVSKFEGTHTAKDILRTLKELSPQIKQTFANDFDQWFDMMNHVRNKIVHNDQTVDSKVTSKRYFDDWFKKEILPSGRVRVMVDKIGMQNIAREFVRDAFIILNVLSTQHNLPLDFGPIEVSQGHKIKQ